MGVKYISIYKAHSRFKFETKKSDKTCNLRLVKITDFTVY